MDWFTSLDGIEELESAEAFLDFFGIPYEAAQVRSKRLHIMHHFNQQIKVMHDMQSFTAHLCCFIRNTEKIQKGFCTF